MKGRHLPSRSGRQYPPPLWDAARTAATREEVVLLSRIPLETDETSTASANWSNEGDGGGCNCRIMGEPLQWVQKCRSCRFVRPKIDDTWCPDAYASSADKVRATTQNWVVFRPMEPPVCEPAHRLSQNQGRIQVDATSGADCCLLWHTGVKISN